MSLRIAKLLLPLLFVSAAWAQAPRSSVISQETLDNLLTFAAMERLTPEQIEGLVRDGRLLAARSALSELVQKANLTKLLAGAKPEDIKRTIEDRRKIDCVKLLELTNRSFRGTLDAFGFGTLSVQRTSQTAAPLDSLALMIAEVQFSVCNAYRTDWKMSGQTWLNFENEVVTMRLAFQGLIPLANKIRDTSLSKKPTEGAEDEFNAQVDSIYKAYINFLSNARQAGMPGR